MIKPIDLDYIHPIPNELYEDWIKRVVEEINRIIKEINEHLKNYETSYRSRPRH